MKKSLSKINAKQKSTAGKNERLPYRTLLKKDPSIYYAIVAIILTCFLFYGNTLTLKYAYDDLMVITGNQFTKQGFHGIGNILTTDFFTGFFGKDNNMVSGGRYRPLSLVTFAIEYQFFGENPLPGHLVNVLLFTAVCILLLIILRKLADSRGFQHDLGAWYFSAPFLISLLFAAHPVHTEVVANIKSRDEILAFLFCLLTFYFALKFLEKRKVLLAILSGFCFFLALLAKENSAAFLVVQPVTLYFFTRNKTRKNLVTVIPLVISTAIFLVIRQTVVSHTGNHFVNDLMNNPFVEMTLSQKYSTILYTLGLYIKLLIFPHPLTSDYYPYHIPIINPGDWRAIVPLIIYVLMIVFIILKIRRKNLVSYCLLYFLITLSIVSNIVFPIGSFLSERFLFMPSLGFCILLGAGIVWLEKRIPDSSRLKKLMVTGFMTMILVLYAYKTISRNGDWYDSYTLFTTDVKVSGNSAKGNEVAGEYIMQKATMINDKASKDSLLRLSITYQQKAIRIYPKQVIALINLAAAYYEYNQDYDTILVVYKTILKYLPGNQEVYTFFNAIMDRYDNVDHKIRLYRDLLQVNPQRFDVNLSLGKLYLGGKRDATKALPFLEKAVSVDPGNFDGQKYLGAAYGFSGKWNDAVLHLELAETIRPGDALLNKSLANFYQNLGEYEKARQVMERVNKGQQQQSGQK